MVAKFVFILSLAVAASAVPLVAYTEPEAPAHYEFEYSVHDQHSGDIKQQNEARAGDAVHGSYTLLQPDGVQRIVEYTADKEHGFNAIVRYEGHPTPAPAKLAYAAPVAKVAYASPVSYAAPVAKVAYAASPISYAAPVAKVTYAASPISYAAPVAKVAYAASPVSYAAPVAKVAYAASPVSYAAPVTKVAYAAPVPKVAYSAPLGHVTFASPAFSYHH